MNALPLAFSMPMVLIGLIALPVIWWLLRITPPRPQEEVFPPLKIFAKVFRKEETPSKSPLWITLLRFILTMMAILALADPVWNPQPLILAGNHPVAVILDNGWASAKDWRLRIETAERLITDAEASDAPIYIIGTAERTDIEIGPFTATKALKRLHMLKPHPIPVNRTGTFKRLAATIATTPSTRIVYLHDGIQTADTAEAFSLLEISRASSMLWYRPNITNIVGLASVDNHSNALIIHAVRPNDALEQRSYIISAFDDKGRKIAETNLIFASESNEAEASIEAPIELRNDFSIIHINDAGQAAATRLLDNTMKRRRVALLSGTKTEMSQPLLSPLYYISRALQPFTELIQSRTADLTQAMVELLDQNPSVMIVADMGKLPHAIEKRLSDWVHQGGMLIRFAGPKLAHASEDDALIPVRLRRGERSLEGTLSWATPQTLAPFPQASPFANLPTPQDIIVTRQILAEPSPDLFENSWANLADGTPFVTSQTRGHGKIVLFHISPDASWSNLPISGTFVEMLRRLIMLSHNLGKHSQEDTLNNAFLPPRLILTADGTLATPTSDTKPIAINGGSVPEVTFDNPPGFYGSQDTFYALNVLGQKSKLLPIVQPSLSFPITVMTYAHDRLVHLRGSFFAVAVILLALDTLLLLWLGGHFPIYWQTRKRLKRSSSQATALVFLLAVFLVIQINSPSPASTAETPPHVNIIIHEDSKPGDQRIMQVVSIPHLAYVLTNDKTIDDISRAGLQGLTQFLAEKTSLEPGEPIGLDLERDELAFYPLIYWPINPDAATLSETAIARIDAYMREGGTVLFDTRDQLSSGNDFDDMSKLTNERLRTILDNMNVPALEPVPRDHVLRKSFFIMPDFPGRYRGSPLWVEASLNSQTHDNSSARADDSISPILITANDFAGAWAITPQNTPLLPTVPNDPGQRLYALRAGVNIVMYTLTGNYKSDQIHVPSLLDRLEN